MNEATDKQQKAMEVFNVIDANYDRVNEIIKEAEELEHKLLGTATPWSTVKDKKEEAPEAAFVTVLYRRLKTLNSQLLHLKDILRSINKEF